MNLQDVVQAWDRADPKYIHPTREHESEEAYWDSGEAEVGRFIGHLSPGATVLDFGCGDGRVAIPLHRRGFHVIAADSSVTMLNRLTEREPDIDTIRTDGSDLVERLGDLALDDVDAVLCLAVLIHHDYACAERILTSLVEALRPGGLLVLNWPTSPTPGERDSWIGITTWCPQRRAEIADQLGLKLWIDEIGDQSGSRSIYRVKD